MDFKFVPFPAMENPDDIHPRLNGIFHNQPNYKNFSQTFGDDIFDPLFLTLNDIDRGFVEPKQWADKRGFNSLTLTDPRSQLPVKRYLYDHTQENIPEIFHSPKCSTLNKAQHSVGVRIVKARQEGLDLLEDDFYIWHRVEKKRLKESQDFAKFVYEYNQTQKEYIYKSARKVMDEYKKLYKSKCKRLLLKYPPGTYNTHMGLPHVKVCRAGLKNQSADIVQVDILKQLGEAAHNRFGINNLEFVNFNCKLEAYVDEYINSEDIKESLEEQLKQECLTVIEQEADGDIPIYYIPLETLVFLLTAGEYCDLPMEVMIDIKEHEEGQANEEKYIIMDSPLPARHLGWHSCKQVVEEASVALLSLNSRKNEEQENVEEIKSVLPNQSDSFFVSKIEDYMTRWSIQPTEKKCTFSKTLSKWHLKVLDNETLNIKHIYTSTDTIPERLGAYSLKLEYKPTFGCEVMTKSELLAEWFKLKLQESTKSTCYRLDINNFQTLLKETQSLPRLEELLKKHYQISMPLLLSNLYEFLTLISNMPSGHYMLRYNSKFKEKILLCKPSLEITQNTIDLHVLLRTEPSDLLFMSQQNYLPISDDLCSCLHLAHNILPCTFPPADKTPFTQSIGKKKKQKRFELVNDRDAIVTKAKNKRCMALNKGRSLADKDAKRAKRARIKKQRAAEMAKEEEMSKEREELEREMLIDQHILGF